MVLLEAEVQVNHLFCLHFQAILKVYYFGGFIEVITVEAPLYATMVVDLTLQAIIEEVHN